MRLTSDALGYAVLYQQDVVQDLAHTRQRYSATLNSTGPLRMCAD